MARPARATGGILGGREWRKRHKTNREKTKVAEKQLASPATNWNTSCLRCEEKFQVFFRHDRDQLVPKRMAERRVKTEGKRAEGKEKSCLLTSCVPVSAAAFSVSSLPSCLCLCPSLLLPLPLFLFQSFNSSLSRGIFFNRPTSWCSAGEDKAQRSLYLLKDQVSDEAGKKVQQNIPESSS